MIGEFRRLRNEFAIFGPAASQSFGCGLHKPKFEPMTLSKKQTVDSFGLAACSATFFGKKDGGSAELAICQLYVSVD